MSYDFNTAIVEMHTVHVYDFKRTEETEAEALARAEQYYKDELALVSSHLKNYGGEYWQKRVEGVTKTVEAGCKIMSMDDFRALEKKRLITGKLTEVTAEDWDNALNVLPPVYWVTINDVNEFCMREMYTGTYTTQYAHDRKTDKYYCAMVDVTDRSTWIHNLLR